MSLHARLRPWTSAVALAAAATLAACGGGSDKKDKPASQTAARVNKEEITVHQINYVLGQQRGLSPERAASAARPVLERLIDQELAVQKAAEDKLDRDAKVLQQLEASRREILARAYAEKIASGAAKPTPDEVRSYYDAHPALFKERRLYSLQELQVEAKPDQIPALQDKLAASRDLPAFAEYLKANEIRFTVNQAVRSAEQLPLKELDRFAAMKDGERLFNSTPRGAQVLALVSSRSQPVSLETATPAIEQFLLNERKRKVVDDHLKGLRSAAKIEYLGEYAGTAPAAAAPEATAPSFAASAAADNAPMPTAAPQVEIAAPTASAVERGIGGMK